MKKVSTRFNGSNRGFSLLEVTMALLVLGLSAAGAYDVLRAGTLRLKKVHHQTEVSSERDVALALLKKDLRCACIDLDDPQTRFVSHHEKRGDHLEFFRASGALDAPPAMDQVEYYLEDTFKTGDWSLWRKSSGRALELCRNVRQFDLRTTDGTRWEEEWGWNAVENRPFQGIRGLPVAVEVHLVFDESDGGETEMKMIAPVMTAFMERRLRG